MHQLAQHQQEEHAYKETEASLENPPDFQRRPDQPLDGGSSHQSGRYTFEERPPDGHPVAEEKHRNSADSARQRGEYTGNDEKDEVECDVM